MGGPGKEHRYYYDSSRPRHSFHKTVVDTTDEDIKIHRSRSRLPVLNLRIPGLQNRTITLDTLKDHTTDTERPIERALRLGVVLDNRYADSLQQAVAGMSEQQQQTLHNFVEALLQARNAEVVITPTAIKLNVDERGAALSLLTIDESTATPHETYLAGELPHKVEGKLPMEQSPEDSIVSPYRFEGYLAEIGPDATHGFEDRFVLFAGVEIHRPVKDAIGDFLHDQTENLVETGEIHANTPPSIQSYVIIKKI